MSDKARPEAQILRGEIYGYSDITDTWYRVTKWTNLGDTKVQARSKDRVDREDVPQEWLDRVEEIGR